MNISDGKNAEAQLNETISDILAKISKKESQKDGVDLLSITKKLSEKKFGKK